MLNKKCTNIGHLTQKSHISRTLSRFLSVHCRSHPRSNSVLPVTGKFPPCSRPVLPLPLCSFQVVFGYFYSCKHLVCINPPAGVSVHWSSTFCDLPTDANNYLIILLSLNFVLKDNVICILLCFIVVSLVDFNIRLDFIDFIVSFVIVPFKLY